MHYFYNPTAVFGVATDLRHPPSLKEFMSSWVFEFIYLINLKGLLLQELGQVQVFFLLNCFYFVINLILSNKKGYEKDNRTTCKKVFIKYNSK